MATFRLLPEDGRDLVRLHTKVLLSSGGSWISACAVLSIAVAHRSPMLGTFIAGMGAAWLISTLTAVMSMRQRLRRHYRNQTEPMTVTMEGDAIRTETQHGVCLARRSGIARTIAARHTFIVEHVGGCYSVVPRKHLSSSESAFLEEWARSGVAAAR